MELQSSLNLEMTQYPESCLKRLIAQPLNGSSVINLGSGAATQSRIEIPHCTQVLSELELGFNLALGNASGAVAPGVGSVPNPTTGGPGGQQNLPYLPGIPAATTGFGNGNGFAYYMPVTYFPLAQRIEVFFADATNKLCEVTNASYYSKMVASLFNNFAQRQLEDFMNFPQDARCLFGAYNGQYNNVGNNAPFGLGVNPTPAYILPDGYYNDGWY